MWSFITPNIAVRKRQSSSRTGAVCSATVWRSLSSICGRCTWAPHYYSIDPKQTQLKLSSLKWLQELIDTTSMCRSCICPEQTSPTLDLMSSLPVLSPVSDPVVATNAEVRMKQVTLNGSSDTQSRLFWWCALGYQWPQTQNALWILGMPSKAEHLWSVLEHSHHALLIIIYTPPAFIPIHLP